MDTRNLLRERLRRSRDWIATIDELEKESRRRARSSSKASACTSSPEIVEDVIPERERALGLYQRAWKLYPDNLKALSRAREVYGEIGRFEMVAKLGEMELRSPHAPSEPRPDRGRGDARRRAEGQGAPGAGARARADARVDPRAGRARRARLRPGVLDRRRRAHLGEGGPVRQRGRGAHATARGARREDRGAGRPSARGAGQADPRQGHRGAVGELPLRDAARGGEPLGRARGAPSPPRGARARPHARRSRRYVRSGSSGSSGSRTRTAARSSSTRR